MEEEEEEPMMSSSDEESDDEDAKEMNAPSSRKRKSPQPTARTRKVQITEPAVTAAGASRETRRAPSFGNSNSNDTAPNRRQIQAALSAMAKKVLGPEETAETSLAAALLHS
jgi:hypothetical protein